MATREHPGPEDLGAAPDAGPGCQLLGIRADTPAARCPTCHCREPLSPGANTTPKLPLAVNVLTYAWSSCLGGGMARASVDDKEAWEDNFQTSHSPAHHIVRWDGGGHRELATERMKASGGSPGWQSFFQVDVGEEEPEILEDIDPHWRATRWLQVAVQGIAEEEVPWYKLVTPLTSGAQGMALTLAKHLLVAWWWNIKVCREDDCPPAPTVLNIGQFMTDEEMAGGHGRATLVHGLFPCIAVGGQGGPQEEMGVAPERGSGGQSLPTRACLLV